MKIYARLPHDRTAEGTIWAINDAARIAAGPEICLGKADNAAAKAHGNPQRFPVKPFGDHPLGRYRVTRIVRYGPTSDAKAFHSYGRGFLGLEPLAGDAATAKANGRTGLAIHGGAPNASGRLRPTNGCLRVPDAFAAQLADLVEVELQAGREVLYEATE